jgi:hypothetical protein
VSLDAQFLSISFSIHLAVVTAKSKQLTADIVTGAQGGSPTIYDFEGPPAPLNAAPNPIARLESAGELGRAVVGGFSFGVCAGMDIDAALLDDVGPSSSTTLYPEPPFPPGMPTSASNEVDADLSSHTASFLAHQGLAGSEIDAPLPAVLTGLKRGRSTA